MFDSDIHIFTGFVVCFLKYFRVMDFELARLESLLG